MNKRNKGFSLIEIMVVLMMVGLVFSLVLFNFGDDGPSKRMQKTVEEFTLWSKFAAEMAIVSGEPIGLILEPPEWQKDPDNNGWSYAWRKMTHQGWQEIESLPKQQVERDILLGITLEEQLWSYSAEAPEISEPIIVFYPTGEVTPFEIEFTHELENDLLETVAVNLWGEVVWKEQQEVLDEIKERNL